MKKHLKVTARLLSDKRYARITIVEQSHFNGEFGNIPTTIGSHGSCFVHGPVRLVSHNNEPACHTFVPQKFRPTVRRSFYVLVQGSCQNSCVIRAESWPDIKAAIEAYNNHEF